MHSLLRNGLAHFLASALKAFPWKSFYLFLKRNIRNGAHFKPKLKKWKKPTPNKKIPYTPGKETLTLILNTLTLTSNIFSKENFSYISGNGKSEKVSYVSGNGTFLYLRKKNFLIFYETKTLKNFLYFIK